MTARRSKRKSLGGGLVLRSGILQKRKQIPADVVEVLGRESVTSLHTSDVKTARVMAREIDKAIAHAVAEVRAKAIFDDVEVARARQVLREQLDTIVEELAYDPDPLDTPAPPAPPSPTPAQPMDLLALVEDLLGKGFTHEQAASMVAGMQAANPAPPRPTPVSDATAQPDLGSVVRDAVADAVATNGNGNGATTHTDSKPIGEAVALFVKAKRASVAGQPPDWTPGASSQQVQRDIERFAETMGPERMLAEVTSDELIEWRDALPNVLTLRRVKTFFKFATQRGWLERNPMDRVPTPKKRRAAKAAFGLEELHILFSPERVEERDKPWHYWAPLFQLCHGLRGGEAMQLRVEDFEHSGPHLVMKVQAGHRLQRVKNSNSIRTLVVHPELRLRGLDKFLKKIGSGWLFPDYVEMPAMQKAFAALEQDPDGDGQGPWSRTYSGWMSRYLKREGGKPGLSPHRLRDLWRDRATAAGLDHLVVEKLGGWRPDSMAGSYGRSVEANVAEVAQQVASVDFEEILSKLPSWDAR